ncbi:hypothetical protein B0H21DRAFT_354410 [Amylocystis lapponica]|nr:hypothetical protein B0H21DRAFT_354410 [Amylocystis lapponica]
MATSAGTATIIRTLLRALNFTLSRLWYIDFGHHVIYVGGLTMASLVQQVWMAERMTYQCMDRTSNATMVWPYPEPRANAFGQAPIETSCLFMAKHNNYLLRMPRCTARCDSVTNVAILRCAPLYDTATLVNLQSTNWTSGWPTAKGWIQYTFP